MTGPGGCARRRLTRDYASSATPTAPTHRTASRARRSLAEIRWLGYAPRNARRLTHWPSTR